MLERKTLRESLAIAAILCLAGCGSEPQPVDLAQVEIRFLAETSESSQLCEVIVSGLPATALSALGRAEASERQAVLSLFAVPTSGGSGSSGERLARPAMIGTWLVEGEYFKFQPRFAWAEGMFYQAQMSLEALERLMSISEPNPQILTAEYEQPRVARPATAVMAIYPSAGQVPANLLKFYIKFSAAMRVGAAYQHLHLRDLSTGELVESPFLELEQELWDPSGTRLTLFLHPGRIKRGLRPNAEEGPALAAGGRYRLEIDSNWRDVHGQVLAAGQQKEIRVREADRQMPSLDSWRLTSPAAGTREALEVSFDETLDHGLLRDALSVVGPFGQVVARTVEISDQERRWRFVPEQPWRGGEYGLQVSTRLEDLAGNTLLRLFDVDLQADPEPATTLATRTRSFQVK